MSRTFATADTSLRGFTLVEMLVVIGIFVILSTIVLVRSSSFHSSILLEGVAYEVALSVREAQVYGSSVGENPLVPEDFDSYYGVYFSTATPGSYIFYADTINDLRYTSSAELIKTYTLPRGFTIAEIEPLTGQPCTGESEAYVLFTRPDPSAFTIWDCSTGTGYLGGDYYIRIASPAGSTKDVLVSWTGQISVE